MSFGAILLLSFHKRAAESEIGESCFLEVKTISKGSSCTLSNISWHPFSWEMEDKVWAYCDSVASFLKKQDVNMTIEISVTEPCHEGISRTWASSRAEKIKEYIQVKDLANINFRAVGYRYGIKAAAFDTLTSDQISSYRTIEFTMLEVGK